MSLRNGVLPSRTLAVWSLAAVLLLAAGSRPLQAQGSTTYYFPHLAVGASWQTTITYINYSPEEVTCQTEFLSDQGTPADGSRLRIRERCPAGPTFCCQGDPFTRRPTWS